MIHDYHLQASSMEKKTNPRIGSWPSRELARPAAPGPGAPRVPREGGRVAVLGEAPDLDGMQI